MRASSFVAPAASRMFLDKLSNFSVDNVGVGSSPGYFALRLWEVGYESYRRSSRTRYSFLMRIPARTDRSNSPGLLSPRSSPLVRRSELLEVATMSHLKTFVRVAELYPAWGSGIPGTPRTRSIAVANFPVL